MRISELRGHRQLIESDVVVLKFAKALDIVFHGELQNHNTRH
jgi:hypothetical protein